MLGPHAAIEITEDHTLTCERLPTNLIPDRRRADESGARVGLQLLQLVGLNSGHVRQAQERADLVRRQPDGDAAVDTLQAPAGLGGRDRRRQLGPEDLVNL